MPATQSDSTERNYSSIRIDDSFRRKLKIAAAKEDCTYQEFLENNVEFEDYL